MKALKDSKTAGGAKDIPEQIVKPPPVPGATRKMETAIIVAILWALLCGILIYVLSAERHATVNLAVNVSYLIISVLGFTLIILTAMLTRLLIRRPAAQSVYRFLNYAGFAFLAYMLLNVPAYINAHLSPYVLRLSEARLYIVIAILGIAIYRLASALPGTVKWQRLSPAARAVGLAMVGLGLLFTARYFAVFWELAAGVGWTLFAGFAAMAGAALGAYGQNSGDPFLEDACHWLTKSQLRNLILGLLLGGYFAIAHSQIVARFTYAPFVEWAVICFIIWLIYKGIKNKVVHSRSVDLRLSSWSKHLQRIERRVDDDFTYLNAIQRQFVEDGGKRELLVYLTTLLYDNGIDLSTIGSILDPLIKYRDDQATWLVFRRKWRRFQLKNEQNRKAVLAEVIHQLEEKKVKLVSGGEMAPTGRESIQLTEV